MTFTEILRGRPPLSDVLLNEVWKSGVMCLDANVLLNVYRYSPKARESFLSLLGQLKERVFVPHQVAHEFARNRQKVILEHFAPFREVSTQLASMQSDLDKKYKSHRLHPNIEKSIKDAHTRLRNDLEPLEKQHEALLSDDSILPQLIDAIGDKAGNPFPADDLTKEYERRKAIQIPPFCVKDDKKEDEDRRRGDVAIWMEMLHYCQATKVPLIFVTDDQKDNWWHSTSGRKDPHPDLRAEFWEATQRDVAFYTSERFIETARSRLGIVTVDPLVQETRDLTVQERVSEKWLPAFVHSRQILLDRLLNLTTHLNDASRGDTGKETGDGTPSPYLTIDDMLRFVDEQARLQAAAPSEQSRSPD